MGVTSNVQPNICHTIGGTYTFNYLDAGRSKELLLYFVMHSVLYLTFFSVLRFNLAILEPRARTRAQGSAALPARRVTVVPACRAWDSSTPAGTDKSAGTSTNVPTEITADAYPTRSVSTQK